MTVPWGTRLRARRRLSKEQGAVTKDWGGRIPTALLYPNSYYTGMSSLGVQSIYSLLNAESDVVCERAFVDSARQLKTTGLVSVESQRELWEFALIALSLSFELDYWNALAALDAADIPLLSAERDERHPLVIAGGPAVTANPETMASFVDAFVIGEAEEVLPKVVTTLREGLEGDRDRLLTALARVPGVYVPSLYSVEHGQDGRVISIKPTASVARYPVVRQWAADLDAFDTSSRVLTQETEFGDMYLVEVARGCSRQCRFCLAGFCYLPKRERSVDRVLAVAKRGLKFRRRIGLVGAAVSDYSGIDEVAGRLVELGAGVSVSSLRVDSLSPALLRALVESGTKTLTLAPEVGSDRLSRVVGKGIAPEQVVVAAGEAARLGVKRFKLYFMVGLPTETEQDVQDIVRLTLRVQREVETHQRGGHLTVNVAPFVPKAQTPFERLPMCGQKELKERLAMVERGLRRHQVEVKGEAPAWSAVQGVLARGDRRLAPVLKAMALRPTLASWHRAISEADLDDAFYLERVRPPEEMLAWSVVSTGVVDRYLHSTAEKALRGIAGSGCGGRHCHQCGVCAPDAANRSDLA